MSINVPQSLLNVSNGVKLEVNMSKFTDKQLKNIGKYVKTLNIPNTTSATAKIAKGLVDFLQIPHFVTSSRHIEWHHIPHSHPIFERMIGAISVALLTPEQHWYYSDRLKDTKRAIENKYAVGNISLWGDNIDDEVKKELASMATYKHEMTPQAEEMLENLLTRKVKTFEMYYNG
jgi:hypothetical protein